MEEFKLDKYIYTVGVKIEDDFIGYVENKVGIPIYVKEVSEAVMFETRNEAYEFEGIIKNNIGKQKNTKVQTFQVLRNDSETGSYHYTIIGEV